MRPRTGISAVDGLHRLLPGKLYFLVGRYGVVDWLAIKIAHHNALTLGGRVVALSPVHPRSKVLDDLATLQAGADIGRLRQGNTEHRARAAAATAEVAGRAIAVVADDSAHAMMLFEMYHRVRELGGVDLLVVPDLESLTDQGDCICGAHNSALARLRTLKALAEHFHVPVVAVAHTRRGFAERRLQRASDVKGGVRVARMAEGVVLVRHDPGSTEDFGPRASWRYHIPDELLGASRAKANASQWSVTVERCGWPGGEWDDIPF